MSKELRNGLIGFAVVFVTSILLGAIGEHGLTLYASSMGFGVFVWFILSQLSNNRNVKNVRDVDRNELLAGAPPAGTGLVYVYREGFVGKAVGFDVVFDGAAVAQLKSPRFTRLIALAGPHILAAGPKGAGGMQAKIGTVSFSIAAGETIVFALKMQMGLMQGTVAIMREPDPRTVMGKLALMTMVAPDLPGDSGQPAAPPPPPQVLA